MSSYALNCPVKLPVFRSFGLSLAAVVACAPGQEFAAWPETPLESLVFVAVTRSGEVIASHGPYSRSQFVGAVEPTVLREFLREGEEMVHISFDLSAMMALVPAFSLARMAELRVEISTAGCAVRSLDNSRQVSLEAIGARVSVLRGAAFLEDGPAPPGLAIRVPFDEAACFSGPAPELTPFGATEHILPVGTLVDGRPSLGMKGDFQQVVPLDADRVLAKSHEFLFVLERGQPWRDSPARLWAASRYPARAGSGGWAIIAFAIDRARSTLEVTRVLVALNWTEPTGVALLEFQLTSAGFGEPRLLFESDEAEFRALLVQPDGRFVAVGHNGLFATGTAFGEPAERRIDGAIGRASLRGLNHGPGEGEPLVVLEGRRTLFFGDAASPEPFRIEPGDPNAPAGALRIVGVGAPGARSYFIDSDGPEVSVRRPDGRRTEFRVDLPADFAACARPVGECGEVELTGDRTAIASTPHGTLVFAPGACSAVLEVDPNTGCARTLGVPGQRPNAEARESQLHVDVTDGVLTVGGLFGRVMQARW